MQNLAGKTAFVTGGASGIGLGIAKALGNAGMNLVVADIRADHLEAATEELGGASKVLALKLDVTDRASLCGAAADAARGPLRQAPYCSSTMPAIAVVGPRRGRQLTATGTGRRASISGGVINGVVTILPRLLAHGEGGHIVTTASMSGPDAPSRARSSTRPPRPR
jgi:NADP-dependent 3-hydroxy acid dehydrogenase YdfG